jgi:hypothetical protein
VIHTVGKSSPFRTISVHSHAKSLARSPDMNKFNAAVRRKRSHCQCCRVSDLLSMTPYLAALDRRRHHRRRSPKPTSSSSSNRNLRTTISPKRNVDVGQQPQRRRAGRCRSVGVRARWNRRRLARARGGSEKG